MLRDCLGISLGHGDSSLPLFCCVGFSFPSKQLREREGVNMHDMGIGSLQRVLCQPGFVAHACNQALEAETKHCHRFEASLSCIVSFRLTWATD